MDRHLGKIVVSYELLKCVMAMPDDARIIGVQGKSLIDYNAPDSFEVLVEHDALPLVGEGECIPRIEPVIREEYQEGNLVPNRVLTWDWNRK